MLLNTCEHCIREQSHLFRRDLWFVCRKKLLNFPSVGFPLFVLGLKDTVIMKCLFNLPSLIKNYLALSSFPLSLSFFSSLSLIISFIKSLDTTFILLHSVTPLKGKADEPGNKALSFNRTTQFNIAS